MICDWSTSNSFFRLDSCSAPISYIKRRIWRALPPVLALVFAAAVGVGRWNMWEDETVSPLTQLVLFPGLPAVFLLLGCYLGWRLWKYLWTPRIIRPR